MKFDWRIAFGVVLVIFGGLALLGTLNILDLQMDLWELLPSAAFILGGLAFLTHLLNDRQKNWWAALPGFILLAIGVQIALFAFFPGMRGTVGGAIFLGGLSLGFWVVYLLRRENWWAIIPGGVLATLVVVTLLSDARLGLNLGVGLGGIFFLGLAVTFGLVAVLPNGGKPLSWAWIPAVALLAMSGLLFAFGPGASGYIWPVFLILVGLFILYESFRRKSQ